MTFSSIQERTKWIVDNAAYWTAVHYNGPKLGYERHERQTKAEILAKASERANETDTIYMIYAVGPNGQDTWVANVAPKAWRKPCVARKT